MQTRTHLQLNSCDYTHNMKSAKRCPPPPASSPMRGLRTTFRGHSLGSILGGRKPDRNPHAHELHITRTVLQQAGFAMIARKVWEICVLLLFQANKISQVYNLWHPFALQRRLLEFLKDHPGLHERKQAWDYADTRDNHDFEIVRFDVHFSVTYNRHRCRFNGRSMDFEPKSYRHYNREHVNFTRVGFHPPI